ncbi:MAG: OmpH family outer membrane protein [Candidatus Omnitrophota bacterium]
MKRFIAASIGFILLCSFSFSGFSKDFKFGCINFLEVFNEYKKTKDYDEMLSKKQEEKEKQIKDQGAAIEKMQSKLSLLKDKDKEKEQQKILDAEKELKKLYLQSRADLKKERDEKMKEIFDDIEKVIKEYSKKNGFDLILHRTALLYADQNTDVTAEILKAVNDSYKK